MGPVQRENVVWAERFHMTDNLVWLMRQLPFATSGLQNSMRASRKQCLKSAPPFPQ